MQVTSTHPRLPEILQLVPLQFQKAVDLGCGKGIMGALLRIYRNSQALLVGIDKFEPYLQFCRESGFYDQLIQADLEGGIPWYIAKQYWDLGLCIEVIEHLSRPQGHAMLNWLENHCRTAIVTTPTKFFQQPEYDGNTKQQHRSLWGPYDFKGFGQWRLRKESSTIWHWIMVKIGKANGTIIALKS